MPDGGHYVKIYPIRRQKIKRSKTADKLAALAFGAGIIF
jgi:hypothetical protein